MNPQHIYPTPLTSKVRLNNHQNHQYWFGMYASISICKNLEITWITKVIELLSICEKSAQISSKFQKILSIILFALEKSSNQRSAYSKTPILTALSKRSTKLSSVYFGKWYENYEGSSFMKAKKWFDKAVMN